VFGASLVRVCCANVRYLFGSHFHPSGFSFSDIAPCIWKTESEKPIKTIREAALSVFPSGVKFTLKITRNPHVYWLKSRSYAKTLGNFDQGNSLIRSELT
jgi:hypothetical protein